MSEKRALGLLLVAAFAVRALYCWGFSPYRAGDPVLDISLYHEFAVSLRDRGAMLHEGRLSAKREPAYPLFLAALYTVFGENYSVIWFFHALLGTATVWLIFLLGGLVFSRNVAWAAALLASFYPQFIFYTAQPERETFQVLIVAAAAYAAVKACRRPSWPLFLSAAFLWALAPLTNSTLAPAGLLAVAGMWWLGYRRGKDLRRQTAVSLLFFLAVYALWPIRNYFVFDRFIPGIAGGGAHLYVSLIVPNEAAGTAEEKRYVDADAVMRNSAGLRENEKDRYFYRAALNWVGRHPSRFAAVMSGSLVKLWRFYPYPRDYGMNYRVIKWIGLLSDGWIIPLALAGLVLAGRRFPEADMLGLILFAVTFTYMLFWAIIRYRLPMMPFVLIYTAYTLEVLAARFFPGRLPFAPAGAE